VKDDARIVPCQLSRVELRFRIDNVEFRPREDRGREIPCRPGFEGADLGDEACVRGLQHRADRYVPERDHLEDINRRACLCHASPPLGSHQLSATSDIPAGRWPDFFVVGASRAGTTFLHRHLGAHPELFMSRVKEPSYFAFSDVQLPPSAVRDAFRDQFVLDERAYRALFVDVGTAMAGEASSAYLDSAVAPGRIRSAAPDARIVISLRDPLDAFESRVRTLRTMRIRRWDDLAHALAQYEAGNDGDIHYYRYYEPVRRYLELFGRDRVKVFLFDDLVSEPQRTVQDVYSFLGVDPSYVPPDIEKRVNHWPLQEDTGITPEVRRHLVEHTRDDTAKLAKLIGRDLRHWACFRS